MKRIHEAASIAIACENALDDDGYEVGNVRTSQDQSRAELPVSHDGERYLVTVELLR